MSHDAFYCKFLVVGAGNRPLTERNYDDFRGLPPKPLCWMVTNTDRDTLDLDDLCTPSLWTLHRNTLGRFDFIIAEHVIEHTKDRMGVLRGLSGLLNEGGILIVEVPNWCHIFAHGNLEHRWTFSRHSFESEAYYMDSLGLRLVGLDFRLRGRGKNWARGEHRDRYLSGFIGRLADRMRLVSGLRFYLKRSGP